MALSPSATTAEPAKSALRLWGERVLALIALTNFGFLLFDATYIRNRDFYFNLVPFLTQHYGERFKGIEPERTTQTYLQTVAKLNSQLQQAGLTPAAMVTLTTLQTQSVDMINQNPFQVAQKSGTLERIKNRMRDRIGQTSAKQAFRIFWSPENFFQKGWKQEMQFFQSQIQPLMATNYFRHIDEDGEPVDLFWQLDLCFISLFGLVILGRAFYLHLFRQVRWVDAVLWRGSDLLLVIPFSRLPIGQGLWLLRIIPIANWLQTAQLVNLQPLQRRFNQRIAQFFAVELTDAVVIRVMDQLQATLRKAAISPENSLLRTQSTAPAIDLNGIDEVAEISSKLANIVVDQILPGVKPELDALLRHSLFGALDQTQLYRSLNWLPGMTRTTNLISLQLTARISETIYTAIQAAIHDPVGQALIRDLLQKLGQQLQVELRQDQTMTELLSLVVAFIEEFKLNYLRSPTQSLASLPRSESLESLLSERETPN